MRWLKIKTAIPDAIGALCSAPKMLPKRLREIWIDTQILDPQKQCQTLFRNNPWKVLAILGDILSPNPNISMDSWERENIESRETIKSKASNTQRTWRRITHEETLQQFHVARKEERNLEHHTGSARPGLAINWRGSTLRTSEYLRCSASAIVGMKPLPISRTISQEYPKLRQLVATGSDSENVT